jgi:hypothetical protein
MPRLFNSFCALFDCTFVAFEDAGEPCLKMVWVGTANDSKIRRSGRGLMRLHTMSFRVDCNGCAVIICWKDFPKSAELERLILWSFSEKLPMTWFIRFDNSAVVDNDPWESDFWSDSDLPAPRLLIELASNLLANGWAWLRCLWS